MKIARNAGETQNVTTELSLQLKKNKNEVEADLKFDFPPLIMCLIQSFDHFVSETSSSEAPETPLSLPS